MVNHRKEIYYYIGVIIAIAVMAWNLCFDIVGDEMHYLATTYRFFRGDAMLIDDWSPEQLNAALQMPFFALFEAITGTTAGVVLYMRFIYLAIQVLVFLFCLKHLPSENIWAKRIGLLAYLFFVPYNLCTISYNTMPLSMMLLVLTILLEQELVFGAEVNVKNMLLAGVFLALAVLGNPYCVLMYIAYAIVVVFRRKNAFSWKSLLWLTIGAGIIAIIFFTFLLSRESMADIIAGIGYVLSEPDHTQTFSGKAIEFLIQSKNSLKLIGIGGVLTLIVWAIDKKKDSHVYVYNSIIFLLVIINTLMLSIRYKTSMLFVGNYVMYMLLMGFILYCIINKKWNAYMIISIVGGVLYSFCTFMASNTITLSTSAAMNVGAVLGMVIVIQDILDLTKKCNAADSVMIDNKGENEKESHAVASYKIVAPVYIGALIGFLFISRILFLWNGNIHSSDTVLNTYGPTKGIYTLESTWAEQVRKYNALDALEISSDDYLYCCSSDGSNYLYAEARLGTFASPFFVMNYDRLMEYYEVHPERFPTKVYYPNPTDEDEASEFFKIMDEKGYTFTDIDGSLIISK